MTRYFKEFLSCRSRFWQLRCASSDLSFITLSEGVIALLLLFFLKGATCEGPRPPDCAPDVPVCICDPTRPGCKIKPLISNTFTDRPPATIQTKFAPTAGAPPLDPQVVLPQLKTLQRQLQAKMEEAKLGELAIIERYDSWVCEGSRAVLCPYLEEFLKNNPIFSLQKSEDLADMTILFTLKGQQFLFEAVDNEGLFGDPGSVAARSVVNVSALNTEWVFVTVPTYEYNAKNEQVKAATLHYQIQRRLVSRKAFDGSEGNNPHTNLSFNKAEQHCATHNANLPNVQVFEYALRQGTIEGHRNAVYEMVRLTNEEDEYEGSLIHYSKHQFDFERYLDKALTFIWRTGSYNEAKRVYQQRNLGFRCARLDMVEK